jgi:uncharacterized membrane protein (DUF106 family)
MAIVEEGILLVQAYPRVSLVMISLIVSLLSTLLTKYTTDQPLLRSIKERQKEIQKEIKEKKYSPMDKRYLELQSELLSLTGKMFKSSFRPIIITLVPFLLLFYFLKNFYTPLLGSSWFWYYLIPSLFVSGVYRKILKVA